MSTELRTARSKRQGGTKRPTDDVADDASRVKRSKLNVANDVEEDSPQQELLTPPPSSPLGDTNVKDTTSGGKQLQLSANAADDASDDSTISGSDGAAQHAIRKANSLRVLEFISQYGAKWDAKLDGRVTSIITDKRAVEFNIAHAPAEADTQWSKITADTFVEYLTLKTDTSQPLRFWIVGEVAHDGAWLMRSGGGEPFKRISVRVKPSVQGEYQLWKDFLGAFGGWKAGYADDGTLSASRSMLYRSKGETTPTAGIFTACYDATKTFTAYGAMEKYTASLIGVNDLVVVEVRLTKWKCDGKGKARYKGDWEQYRVGLELGAVSLLHRGPDTPPPDFLDTKSGADIAF